MYKLDINKRLDIEIDEIINDNYIKIKQTYKNEHFLSLIMFDFISRQIIYQFFFLLFNLI
jgi:hypothetical protein